MTHTGRVVVRVYASSTLNVPICNAVLSVGSVRHVRADVHVFRLARERIGMDDMHV